MDRAEHRGELQTDKMMRSAAKDVHRLRGQSCKEPPEVQSFRSAHGRPASRLSLSHRARPASVFFSLPRCSPSHAPFHSGAPAPSVADVHPLPSRPRQSVSPAVLSLSCLAQPPHNSSSCVRSSCLMNQPPAPPFPLSVSIPSNCGGLAE